MIRILFFKAQQHALFTAPVRVAGHTRASTGKFVAPYTSKRRKRADSASGDLFGVQHPTATRPAGSASPRPALTLQPSPAPVKPPTARQRVQQMKDRMDDLFGEPTPDQRAQARRAKMQQRIAQREEFIAQTLRDYPGLTGLELSDEDGNHFVVFMPDASAPGKFRFTRFDRHGFAGHNTFDSPEKALREAVAHGFRRIATGALDRLSQTDTFRQDPTPPPQPEPKPVPKITKEPWQMTLAELNATGYIVFDVAINKQRVQAYHHPDQAKDQTGNETEHKRAVISAILAGKPVPAEVLADYPDLNDLKNNRPPLRKRPAPAPEPAGNGGSGNGNGSDGGNGGGNDEPPDNDSLMARGKRVRRYVEQVLAKTATASHLKVGIIGHSAAQRIQEKIGLPVDAAMEVVIADSVVHATRQHPDLTGDDWEELPKVTHDFDEVAPGRPDRNPRLSRLVIRKTFADGRGYGAVLAFAQGRGQKRLNLVSYFKGRGKSLDAWWQQNQKGLDLSSVPNRTEHWSKPPQESSKPTEQSILPPPVTNNLADPGLPSPSTTDKPSWEMTPDEFAEWNIQAKLNSRRPPTPEQIPGLRANWRAQHRQIVWYALARGETVPPEILAYYPDLQPKPEPAPAKVAPPAPAPRGTQPGEKYQPDQHLSSTVLLPAKTFRTGGSVTFTIDGGARNIRIPPEFQRALNSMMDSIIPLYQLDRDQIEVRFSRASAVGRNNEALAYYNDNRIEIRRQYLTDWIYGGINSKGNASELIELICHELTHLWQHKTGMWGKNEKGERTWEGKSKTEAGELYSKLAWSARPWEQHAMHMQGVMTKRVIDDLVGQRILDPSLAPANEQPQHKTLARQEEEGAKPPLRKAVLLVFPQPLRLAA